MAKSCATLKSEYSMRNPVKPMGEKIIFSGVGENDVYNIASPLRTSDGLVIPGRVEPRADGLASVIRFFERRNERYELLEDVASLPLQDPFHACIQGFLVVGGVYVHKDAQGELTGWETRFYRGIDIRSLSLFAKGPQNMKDIRLVELQDGRVGVFTRPHGLPDARAKIGYLEVETLAQLTPEIMEQAILLDDLFLPEEWGGANEIHLLEDGRLGVLGHISCQTGTDTLHYHAMAFVFDPVTRTYTEPMIIADRACFPEGPAKEARLWDVVFTGGMIRNNDGTATLYVGISDAEAAKVEIPDPFCVNHPG